MADITMCDGKDCPFKESCYRFLATPNQFKQSYFVDSPFNKAIGDCDYYWDYGNYDTNKKIDDVKKL